MYKYYGVIIKKMLLVSPYDKLTHLYYVFTVNGKNWRCRTLKNAKGAIKYTLKYKGE